jgi:hypothetical protein
MSDGPTPQLPWPDPALASLDRMVGSWSIEGNVVGSDDKTIKGQTTFRWLPGRFFMEQRFSLNFTEIESLELVGYDPEAKSPASTVYSNLTPAPLPYSWDVNGKAVTITVAYGPLDATVKGEYRDDGTFSGG